MEEVSHPFSSSQGGISKKDVLRQAETLMIPVINSLRVRVLGILYYYLLFFFISCFASLALWRKENVV